MARCSVFALLLSLGVTTSPAAQLCSGEPTFVGAAARFFASAAFGQAQTYHVGFALGGTRLFGWGEVGMATYHDGESGEYRLGGGYQLSRPAAKLHVCPEVLFGLTTVSDVGGTGVAFDELTGSAGADVGYVLLRKRSTRIVPTVNLQFVAGEIKWTYANGVKRTRGIGSYGLLGAGIGVGFGEVTASPSIILPLGQGEAEMSYMITFSARL